MRIYIYIRTAVFRSLYLPQTNNLTRSSAGERCRGPPPPLLLSCTSLPFSPSPEQPTRPFPSPRPLPFLIVALWPLLSPPPPALFFFFLKKPALFGLPRPGVFPVRLRLELGAAGPVQRRHSTGLGVRSRPSLLRLLQRSGVCVWGGGRVRVMK